MLQLRNAEANHYSRSPLKKAPSTLWTPQRDAIGTVVIHPLLHLNGYLTNVLPPKSRNEQFFSLTRTVYSMSNGII